MDFIYINNNSLSKILCDEIIEKFAEEQDKSEGVTGSGWDHNVKHTMDCNISNHGRSPKWKEIVTCLNNEVRYNVQKYLTSMNNEYSDVNKDQCTTCEFKFLQNQVLSYGDFQVQRYDKNKGRYVYHSDDSISFEQHRSRVLTYLWYLNDVSEGGETDICAGTYIIKPECGKMLLFPATWTFPHAGNIPLSGEKYIITGWIYKEENLKFKT